MNLANFNLWAYHTVEVFICDLKLMVYNWRLRQYDNQIARLEAQRTR